MLPDGVHDLALTFDRGDRQMTIHPVAVETPRGVLLVDVGLPGTLDAVGDALADAGLALDDVWAVLLTHHDGDHAGAAAALVDRTDAAVFAHPRAVPYLDGRETPIKSDGDRYPPVAVDVALGGDSELRTDAGPMTVVETPGHAPGHVSCHFREGDALLAADALTAEDGDLRGPNEPFTPEMDEAVASVGTLAALSPETVLCYHGGLVTDADVAAVHESLRT